MGLLGIELDQLDIILVCLIEDKFSGWAFSALLNQQSLNIRFCFLDHMPEVPLNRGSYAPSQSGNDVDESSFIVQVELLVVNRNQVIANIALVSDLETTFSVAILEGLRLLGVVNSKLVAFFGNILVGITTVARQTLLPVIKNLSSCFLASVLVAVSVLMDHVQSEGFCKLGNSESCILADGLLRVRRLRTVVDLGEGFLLLEHNLFVGEVHLVTFNTGLGKFGSGADLATVYVLLSLSDDREKLFVGVFVVSGLLHQIVEGLELVLLESELVAAAGRKLLGTSISSEFLEHVNLFHLSNDISLGNLASIGIVDSASKGDSLGSEGGQLILVGKLFTGHPNFARWGTVLTTSLRFSQSGSILSQMLQDVHVHLLTILGKIIADVSIVFINNPWVILTAKFRGLVVAYGLLLRKSVFDLTLKHLDFQGLGVFPLDSDHLFLLLGELVEEELVAVNGAVLTILGEFLGPLP